MIPQVAPELDPAQGGVVMTQREAHLRALGITYDATTSASDTSSYNPSAIGSLSGYGAFTPITVRSYTVLKNAELERAQPRD